ncbi:MAG: IS701 family transposase [Chloroflexi bacterium]|nr:IS701 family transposase [Chloroflexota bacterium]
MPAIVEYPTLVKEALNQYAPIFINDPERRHFAEYLTGLLVAQRKTVSGITSEFAMITDQSCLNRWLGTLTSWDEQQLNERRLDILQQGSDTHYTPQGVIPIDNVLFDHDGKLIEDVGWFWDHADQRYLVAHDYLIANYVCPSGKHYPLEFRRFVPRDRVDNSDEFSSHTDLCLELIDWVIQRQIPGDFTLDSYFTNAEILNHINLRQRFYVGDLKFNRKVQFKGQTLAASDMAKLIPPTDRKMVERDGKRQFYFTKTIRINEIAHRVRVVILWKHQGDTEPTKILITNHIGWEIIRILSVYRNRWTGTETFHRDGKQQLGMGDCQLRSRLGQTRHLYLVFVAYSCIIAQLGQDRPQEWARVRLMTVGEACRAVLRETLGDTLDWALQHAAVGWSTERIKLSLALP